MSHGVHAYDSIVQLTSTTTIAAAASDTTVTPKKPTRAGVIVGFDAVVFDPADDTIGAHPLQLLDRIGARIFVRGMPVTGTGSSDYIPLSILLGYRAPIVGDRQVPPSLVVGTDDEISAEFKSLITSGDPALKVYFAVKIASNELIARIANDDRAELARLVGWMRRLSA